MADVSICMPYFEREPELRAGIESFRSHGYFSHSYSYMIELSIVDDGSIKEPITPSHEIFKDIDNDIIITSLSKKDRWDNPCVPLNIAVSQSNSPWVLLQSPETIHRVDIVEPMMTRADRPEVSVLCPVVSRDARGDLIWRCHPSRPDKLWFCQLVSRELWERAEGCDERFRGGGGSDDRALQYRLEKAGVEWVFLPEEYWAYHRKHPKPYRYRVESNRQKIAEFYGVTPHVLHDAKIGLSTQKRLGLYKNEHY